MHAFQHRLLRGLLACACAVAPGLDALAAPAQAGTEEAAPDPSPFEWVGPVSAMERTVAAQLRAARAAGPDQGDVIGKRLLALGAPSVPALLAILGQCRVPRAESGDAPQKLSEAQRAITLAALARLPRPAVVTGLDALLADNRDPAVSLAAIAVLGVVGEAKDLPRIPELAPHEAGTSRFTRAARDAMRTAFAGILAREKRLPDSLQPLLESPDREVTEQLLGALADLGDPRGLPVCFAVGQTRVNLSQTAIALLPRFRRSNDVASALEIATWLRGQVDFHRVERTRAVFNALAMFDEGASFPLLVDGLGSDEVALRDSALVALRRISGLSMPPDRERWSIFFRDESSWFETQRPRQAAIIAEGRPAEVGQAVRNMIDHRLFKSQIASDLLPLLANANPEVRLLAIDAFVKLGSRQVVPQLIDALDDADPRVSRAAHAALRAIVGIEAPTAAALARVQLLGDP